MLDAVFAIPTMLKRRFARWQLRRSENLYKAFIGKLASRKIVVNIDDFLGSFEIDVRSHILMRLFLLGNYEPEIVERVRVYLNPEKDALDIGANIGLFTVLFSKLLNKEHKVLAVEPTPLALTYLKANLQRNNCTENTVVFEGIVANAVGKYRLNIIPGKEEYSSIGEIVHPAVKGSDLHEIEVRGSTIDNLVAQYDLKPGFIKIDTEGAELSVLYGAMNTIKKYKPVILSELYDVLLSAQGYSSKQGISLLEELGYDVYDSSSLKIQKTYPFVGNILAIPRSKSK